MSAMEPPITKRRANFRKWGLVSVGLLAVVALFGLLPAPVSKPPPNPNNGRQTPPDPTAFSVMWDEFNLQVIIPIRLAWMIAPKIIEALDRGTGIYPSKEAIVQDYDSGEILWKWIDRPDRVIEITHNSIIEPFPPRTLAALQKVFNDTKEPAIRLHAATLLARYGSERGMDYIRTVATLGQPADLALNAATTLALNRDTNSLPAILLLLGSTYPEHADLANALGKWSDPRVVEALERRVAADKIRARHYAFALMMLDRDGGRASFQRSLEWSAKNVDSRTKRSPDLSTQVGNIKDKACAARLGMIATNEFLAHVDAIYRRGYTYDNSGYVMPGLALAGPRISTAPLLRYLEEYVPRHQDFLSWTNPPPQQGIPGASSRPTPHAPAPPVGFMLGAAELLAEWGVEEALPHLRRITPILHKTRPRMNRIVSNLEMQRLGLALHKLDPEGWREVFTAALIRQEFIDRIPELAKLRPVAAGYLPKQDRLNSR